MVRLAKGTYTHLSIQSQARLHCNGRCNRFNPNDRVDGIYDLAQLQKFQLHNVGLDCNPDQYGFPGRFDTSFRCI